MGRLGATLPRYTKAQLALAEKKAGPADSWMPGKSPTTAMEYRRLGEPAALQVDRFLCRCPPR
jgi:hypothetical protein